MKKKTKHSEWTCVDCGIKKQKLTRGETVRVIIAMLDVFFDGKFEITNKWLRCPNPLLGNVRPWDMIEVGRHEKLLKFVKDRIAENKRP